MEAIISWTLRVNKCEKYSSGIAVGIESDTDASQQFYLQTNMNRKFFILYVIGNLAEG